MVVKRLYGLRAAVAADPGARAGAPAAGPMDWVIPPAVLRLFLVVSPFLEDLPSSAGRLPLMPTRGNLVVP